MRYAAMVGFVIENLASCKLKVPFLKDHAGEITILKIAVAKDISRKPKVKKFPTGGGGATTPFIAIAQVTANKFVVHPGPPLTKNKCIQFPTALLQTMDSSGVSTKTDEEKPVVKKRRSKAADKPENEPEVVQAPKDIFLPEDLREFNASNGSHRGLKDVVALGTFMGEKASAENRRLDLAKACSQLNEDPLSWDLKAERTKCFVVYKVGEVHFCVASYIKLLVQFCAGVDPSQESGQSQ